jgi:hypothetical protein
MKLHGYLQQRCVLGQIALNSRGPRAPAASPQNEQCALLTRDQPAGAGPPLG